MSRQRNMLQETGVDSTTPLSIARVSLPPHVIQLVLGRLGNVEQHLRDERNGQNQILRIAILHVPPHHTPNL